MKIEEVIKEKYLYSKKKNIFKFCYFYFQYLKSLLKRKKTYSNWGVDLIIKNIFRNKKKGFYIDVGCNHPFLNNHTLLLYKLGWSGINIDLDYNSIDMFNYFRKKDINLQYAISDSNNEVELFFYHNRAAKNTISKDFGAGAKSIKKIKTITLNQVLDINNIQSRIDFLTIDVEGNEMNVLKGFDLNKYNPTLIMLEFIEPGVKEFYDKNIQRVQNSEIYKYLIKNNYKLINWNHDDLLFISNDYKKHLDY